MGGETACVAQNIKYWLVFLGVGIFFAHPFRVLNEISDPSKATSARPRKLGLPDFVGTSRPQTVRVRPAGRVLRL
jgi:hypothetical protein